MKQALWEGSHPTPQGKTPQERPLLVWQMRPKDNLQFRQLQMKVDGKPIPTRYDSATKSVIGEPQEPLPLGLRKAVCEVWFSNDKGVEMEWEFTRVTMPPPPPKPDFVQQEMVAKVNQLRRGALLPDTKIEPALCLAATRHSRYLLANRLTPQHEQVPGKPEFFGKDPAERSERAGYFDPSYEVIANGHTGPEAIQRLIDAPYHRSALLQPGGFNLGAGKAGDRVTLLCAVSSEQQVVVYPADGHLEVPVLWDEIEIPDPLRLYPNADRMVGYPITLHAYGEEGSLTLLAAQLLDSNGMPVACYVNSPENDTELQDTVLMMPKRPLQPTSAYRVQVAVKTSSGKEVTRSWQFTTGKTAPIPAPQAPKPAPKPMPKPTPKPPPKTTKKKK